ncbi:MAG: spermidine/putrescine ABC transporter permease [Gammaproteobacteria bacterium RIFCSPHIGHO2_12_FULL_42_10]|nr:MAG: spermidine/putrescine ABC transporter permease [Gammaproteobacteria bacterium RIFCSPHIGHO2_12_FULL_42_10]
MKLNNGFRNNTLILIWLWLALFALLPLCMIVLESFSTHQTPQPTLTEFTLDNYRFLINTAYFMVFEKSLLIAGSVTLLCLLLGYPFAYIVARMNDTVKNYLILFVIIPFWTSSLIRSYALIAILKTKGILNSILLSLGIIHQPLAILFTNYAVILGLVYNLLPFMILPVLTNIERLDYRLVQAARDLGANWLITFVRIILPLTMPGIIAGSILVFLPAMTIFYIPDILGGAKSILLGNLIQNQFLIAHNWPLGSAISTLLTLILVALVLIYWKMTRSNKKSEWL